MRHPTGRFHASLAGAALILGSLATLAAAPRWPDERTAGPFHCHADFSLSEHQTFLAETAQLEKDLMQVLGLGPSREPVHLFLFERKTTYEGYVKRHFPNTPLRRALFIKDHGPGMVFAYRGKDFEIDVRHECTHALLHASLPMVPLWLDEGLAEYFEAPPNRRAYGRHHLMSVKWRIRLGQRLSMDRLEKISVFSNMENSDYRDAWAWTHFMLHGSAAAHDELVRFLADIQAHSPPGRLSQRLRQRLPDLDREFVEHFKRWKR